MSTAPADSNSFLKTTRENTDLNQYWYSSKTIHALIQEIQNCGAKRIAFLSTPSLYFSLTDETLQRNSCVFDVRSMSLPSLSLPPSCQLHVHLCNTLHFMRTTVRF